MAETAEFLDHINLIDLGLVRNGVFGLEYFNLSASDIPVPMRRFYFIVTNILLPLLAVLAMAFMFWHWKGYPLSASLASGKVGALVQALKEWKNEKILAETEKAHIKNCRVELHHLSFKGAVLVCENADQGNWFLKFHSDGTIKIGLPPGAITQFYPYAQGQEPVNLDEVFAEPVFFQRTNPTLLTIRSLYGPRHFRLTPDFSAADPALACRNLTLEEIAPATIPPFQLRFSEDKDAWIDLFPEETQESPPEPFSEALPVAEPDDTDLSPTEALKARRERIFSKPGFPPEPAFPPSDLPGP